MSKHQWLSERRALIVSATALVGAAVVSAMNFQWATITVQQFLASHIEGQPPQLSSGSAAVIAALAIASMWLFVAVSLLAVADTAQIRAFRTKLQRADVARRETCHQAFLVANRLQNDRRASYSFVRQDLVVSVDADGTVAIHRVDQLRANGGPLLLWKQFLLAEPEGDPAEYVSDVNFQVEAPPGSHEVNYLILKDEPREKEIAVVHLPFINPSEERPRSVVTTLRWKRMMRRLVEKKEEVWTWTLISSTPIKELSISFFAHPDLGKLSCQLVSEKPGAYRLDPASSASQWQGWTFTLAEARGDSFDYSFRLRLGQSEAQSR